MSIGAKRALHILLAIAIMYAIAAFFLGWKEATAPLPTPVVPVAPAELPAVPVPLEPLTAPLTAANSYLHDFGDGKIVRVPKSILRGADFRTLPQPFARQTVSMVFWFPEMVPTVWKGQMATIFEELQGTFVPEPDRFRVNILNMFYSPGELGNPENIDTAVLRMPDWRPKTMRRIRENGEPRSALHVNDVVQSEYKGLRKVVPYIADPVQQARSEKVWKQNGWDGITQDFSYIEDKNSPYEIHTRCSTKAGLGCEAYVYSKTSGFQYRMLYPSEAIAHTDELVRSINKMVDEWLKEPLH